MMAARDLEGATSAELDQFFRAARGPRSPSRLSDEEMRELSGPGGSCYRVTMLDGVVPDMGGWPLRHRKFIPAGISGTNVFRKDLRWGSFHVFVSPWYGRQISDRGGVWDGDGQSSMLFYYDTGDNPFPVSKVRDYVRFTGEPGLLVGKAYVLLGNRLRFLGHFLLRREPSLKQK